MDFLKVTSGILLLGVVIFLAYVLVGANMGMQDEDGMPSIVSVSPEVTEQDGEFTVSGEIGHSGLRSEQGALEGVRVRILAADNSTLEVVDLGDIELATIESDRYTFTVTTDREPARIIVEIDEVTTLEESRDLQIEGRARDGDNWRPFFESPDTWRYDVRPRELRAPGQRATLCAS